MLRSCTPSVEFPCLLLSSVSCRACPPCPPPPRRAQLKALVDLHGEDTGLGGKLSADEIKVITGALDLTSKIAFRSMTPLSAVFMLSTDDVLGEGTLRAVLESGHSRIPIHRAGDRSDLVRLLGGVPRVRVWRWDGR